MRRALIIGINNYRSFPLDGCVQDAISLQNVLSRHADGSLNFDCRIITSPPQSVTRSFLRTEIASLFESPAEVAYLHFSGHGHVSRTGGVILADDCANPDDGMSMSDIIAFANQSPVSEIFITLDCCHSGAIGEIPGLRGTEVLLREGISIIAACRRSEKSHEGKNGGMLTGLVVDAFDGCAAGTLGNVTAASIYSHVDAAFGAWDQRPLFKSHVSRVVTLRSCKPKVELELIQALPGLFSSMDQFIKTGKLGLPNQATPHDITILDRAGLVEYVQVAQDEGIWHLTNLGRYYWRLVREDKI